MAHATPQSHDHGDDRLIRALQRGGMAVASQGGGWLVFRDRDRRRRMVGTFDPVAIDALLSAGQLCRLGEGGDTLVWSGPMPGAIEDGASRPTPKRPVPHPKPGTQPRRTAMERALETLSDDRQRQRVRNAARRLLGDIHRAATPQSVTMRWDPAGAVDGTRRSGREGISPGAARAARTLSAVQKALGASASARLMALVLHERPLARIAAEAGWSEKRTARELGQGLVDLADAYDRYTRGST